MERDTENKPVLRTKKIIAFLISFALAYFLIENWDNFKTFIGNLF